MKKALVVFQSISGNTAKVAGSIHAGLTEGGFESTLKTVSDSAEEDFYDYDLVCFGAPSYNWHVPRQTGEFLKTKFSRYSKSGHVIPNSPKIPGKNCLVFCTYSGPHTGIREAVPAGKYIGQFFEHFGFTVVDEWYILSEFTGSEELSTKGRMGDVRGLPSEQDLSRLRERARNLALRL
ncbi:MAG: flavodoxin domain-containing protein [Oscillospiraceae bacterium]|nr:flavodoxin domain-containing protein [Oscillospiraceae bacterium]